MSTLQTIGSVVGMVTGVSGFVLGIVNYWEHRVTTRPRIKVVPGVRSFVDPATMQRETNVGVVEVRNVGQVPVMVATIGFLSKRRGRKGISSFAYKSTNGVELPGELKPGHIAVLQFDLLAARHGGRAVAETMVGKIFKASRRDTKKFTKRVKTVLA